jgi:hypothetical protein
MPWKVFREHGKFCLHKMNGSEKGDLIHCHDTAEMARRQQAALYVSENKELEPEDAIILDEDGMEYKEWGDSVPAYATGAHSFGELESEREAREKVHELSELMSDFQSLVGNIIYTPAEEVDADKIHELDLLYDDFKSRATGLLEEPMDEEEKAVWSTASANNLPDSAFLYIEPGGKKDSEGKTVPRSLRHLPVRNAEGKLDPAHIRNAAARANQVKLSGGKTISPALANRLIARARSLLKRTKKETILETAVNKVKEFLGIEEPSDIMIYKEEDGSYGWVTDYSNKFMDRDNPPNIIASAAHQKFVDKVDKGEAPLPELHLWHVPEWRIGYATAVAYDDSGFPIAIGRFDNNKESQEIAEWLSKQKDFGVSHGMLNRTIQFDQEDPSIIIAYETHEISPLPREHAANLLADWYVIKNETKELEEVNMTIPEEKRQELLKRGLPEATLSALEERNRVKSETATAEGIKSKEAEEVQPVPESEAVSTETVAPEAEKPVETEDVKTSDFPTRQEVAEAVANVVAPVVEELKAKFEELDAKMGEAMKQLAEFQTSDEKRIKEIISMTPRDSLASLMAARFTDRASSSKQTKVGNNDNLLEKKPREEKEEDNGRRVGIPFVDKMLQDGK